MDEQRRGYDNSPPGKTPGKAEGELRQDVGRQTEVGKTPGKAEGDVSTVEGNLNRSDQKKSQ